jgi:hypothetical protein
MEVTPFVKLGSTTLGGRLIDFLTQYATSLKYLGGDGDDCSACSQAPKTCSFEPLPR